jgi:septum formation protein
MKAFKHNIILASKSPRRSELLSKSGFDFEVKTLEVEENYPETMDVHDVPEFLARKKATESRSLLKEDQILITADTVVIFEGEIFGKPKSAKHAFNMLTALSSKKHTVVTGVCILSNEKELSFSDTSYVHLAYLSEEEIHFYVDTYKPFDKAGSYAIQEWIGLCKIEKIEGSYSNIMGLPMQKLYPALVSF